jgi:hypothetical protein
VIKKDVNVERVDWQVMKAFRVSKRYVCTYPFLTRHQMEVRGQFHASAAVLPLKEPLVPIEEESRWFERFGDITCRESNPGLSLGTTVTTLSRQLG